jgi:4a-hydroxytetrahydrobiopterin dehydratase
MDTMTNHQIHDAGLADWRKLAQALYARFSVPGYAQAAAFVSAVAGTADETGQQPELRVTSGAVDVTLCTRQDGLWVTEQDIALARRVSEIAREQGLEPEPTAVSQLEIALDTAHEDAVAPFWAVLLTGSPESRIYDSVFDRSGRVPSVWFQGTDEHQPPRQRWHFDLWLAPEVAEERIAAAVAAGGTLVDESEAPAFTVLADADGNRVCICTSLARE